MAAARVLPVCLRSSAAATRRRRMGGQNASPRDSRHPGLRYVWIIRHSSDLLYDSWMDYRRPVEALIPGVQGRVLGVLARTDTDLTMRAVADLAGVSPQQASVVIGRLVDLGVVERRDVPPASLVRLAAGNLAAEAVISISRLRDAAVGRLAELAALISPAPASLVVFGSFARAEAGAESDIDVLAVRPALRDAAEELAWTASLGEWIDRARYLLGSPVNHIEVDLQELPGLLSRKGSSVWKEAAREGLVIAGTELAELARAA